MRACVRAWWGRERGELRVARRSRMHALLCRKPLRRMHAPLGALAGLAAGCLDSASLVCLAPSAPKPYLAMMSSALKPELAARRLTDRFSGRAVSCCTRCIACPRVLHEQDCIGPLAGAAASITLCVARTQRHKGRCATHRGQLHHGAGVRARQVRPESSVAPAACQLPFHSPPGAMARAPGRQGRCRLGAHCMDCDARRTAGLPAAPPLQAHSTCQAGELALKASQEMAAARAAESLRADRLVWDPWAAALAALDPQLLPRVGGPGGPGRFAGCCSTHRHQQPAADAGPSTLQPRGGACEPLAPASSPPEPLRACAPTPAPPAHRRRTRSPPPPPAPTTQQPAPATRQPPAGRARPAPAPPHRPAARQLPRSFP